LNPYQKIINNVDVNNIGQVAEKEVVMLFSTDEIASMTPDNRRLRRFQEVSLESGNSKISKFLPRLRNIAFVLQVNNRITNLKQFYFQHQCLSDKLTQIP